MKVFGIVGWKDSGKTTLVTKLIHELKSRGLRIATVKHAHCQISLDDPGKDSHRHRMAGAEQVVIASPQRWGVIKELNSESEPTLADFLSKLDPVDIVLVEGYKYDNHPKIQVVRPSHNPDAMPDAKNIIAIATDQPAGVRDSVDTILDLNYTPAIANFIIELVEL